MTVQELIEELLKVEDKDLEVFYPDSEVGEHVVTSVSVLEASDWQKKYMEAHYVLLEDR